MENLIPKEPGRLDKLPGSHLQGFVSEPIDHTLPRTRQHTEAGSRPATKTIPVLAPKNPKQAQQTPFPLRLGPRDRRRGPTSPDARRARKGQPQAVCKVKLKRVPPSLSLSHLRLAVKRSHGLYMQSSIFYDDASTRTQTWG